MMKKFFLVCSAVCFLFAGCSFFGFNNNKPAAVVNGKIISLSELNDLHKRALKILKKNNPNINETISNEVRGSLLKKLIDNTIIKQEAKNLNLEVDRFERVADYRQYKKSLGGSKALSLHIEAQELTTKQIMDTFVNRKLRKMMAEKMNHALDTSDEELKKYFNQNKEKYVLPESVRVSHILLKVGPKEPAEKQKIVFEKAKFILEQANLKKETFEDLVAKYSEGQSSEQKGDLGFIPRGKMAKSFEEAAFSHPVGSLVGPVKTDYGYHVIKITDKMAKRIATFEEVKPRIIQEYSKLQTDKFIEAFLNEARKKADVKIFDISLNKEKFLDDKPYVVMGLENKLIH